MIKYFTKIAEKNKKDGGEIDYMAITFLVWNSIPMYIVSALVMSAAAHSFLFGPLLALIVMVFYFLIIYFKCKGYE